MKKQSPFRSPWFNLGKSSYWHFLWSIGVNHSPCFRRRRKGAVGHAVLIAPINVAGIDLHYAQVITLSLAGFSFIWSNMVSV